MDEENNKRVYGLEVEYGLVFLTDDPLTANSGEAFDLLPKDVGTYLFRALRRICRIGYYERSGNGSDDNIFNFFSRNGGRIYLDTGQHPETSTPECATLREVVLHDKAAERILEEALLCTREFLKRNREFRETRSGLLLFRNNSHGINATFGCHENYLFPAGVEFYSEIVPYLLPFLVSRQIFCGAGKIWDDRYEISQRARFIRTAVTPKYSSDQAVRSIIGARGQGHLPNMQEVLADSEVWRRLHLVLGDSNMSEYSAWLKLGTTALVMRMIEDKFIEWKIRIPESVKTYHDVSRDLTCRREYEVILRERSGRETVRKFSAVEIQERYWAEAQRYLAERPDRLPPENFREFGQILAEWRQVLGKLKSDPMLLKEEIDWVIKKNLLDRYRASRQISWIHPRLKAVDLQYHNIDRDEGLYYLLEKEGQIRRILDDARIKSARSRPPDGTRANGRARLIKWAEKQKIGYWCNWSRFYVYPQMEKGIMRPLDYWCQEPSRSAPDDWKNGSAGDC